MSNAFDLVRYRVHRRRWSSISAILSESGASDTEMKMGLKALHGVTWPAKDDPFICFTEDTQQRDEFRKNGVINPTLCQLLLTSRCFALDEDDCKEKFEALLRKENE